MLAMTSFFFLLRFAEISYSKLASDTNLYLNPVRLIFVRNQANRMVLTALFFKPIRLSRLRL